MPQRGHDFQTVQEAGCSGKENGELLSLADTKSQVLVTSEKNIRHQQNLTGKKIAVLLLRSTSNDLEDLRPHIRDALKVAAGAGWQPFGTARRRYKWRREACLRQAGRR